MRHGEKAGLFLPPEFVELGAPDSEDLVDLAVNVSQCFRRWLSRCGLQRHDGDELPPVDSDAPTG